MLKLGRQFSDNPASSGPGKTSSAPVAPVGDSEPMIWFYQRGGQHLYYEVRLRQDGPGFELGIWYPEGTVLTEHFDTEDALAEGFINLQERLSREGWGPLERKTPDLALNRQGTRRVC
jgi:hypothetical protein